MENVAKHLPKDYSDKLIKCPVCGEQFKGRDIVKLKKGKARYLGNKKFWSDACRNEAWRDRNPRVRKSDYEAFKKWQNSHL